MLFALILLWLNLLEGKATICLLKPLVLKTFGFLDHSGRNYAILTSFFLFCLNIHRWTISWSCQIQSKNNFPSAYGLLRWLRWLSTQVARIRSKVEGESRPCVFLLSGKNYSNDIFHQIPTCLRQKNMFAYTGGPPLTQKLLTWFPLTRFLAYVCASGGFLC